MSIEENKVVGLTYVLSDSEGETIEERGDDDPLYYLHGRENIIPGLESSLEGMEDGEDFEISIDAEDAYGEYSPELVQTVEREQLEEAGYQELELGEAIDVPIETEDGKEFMFTMIVQDIADDEVVLDGNHPLAGQNLSLEGHIVEVREATEEELAQGSLDAE